MTHRGGWRNLYKDYSPPDAVTSVSKPPDKPTFEDSAWPERRIRCIKRVDGHIEEVVWTAEHPDAQENYETLRERDRQREKLDQMDIEAIRQARAEGELDTLSWEEVEQAISDASDEEDNDSDQDSAEDELTELEERLIWEVMDDHDGDPGESAKFGLDKLMELKRIKRGQCAFCSKSFGTRRCSDCGTLVCASHRDRDTDRCPDCQ